MTLSRRPEKNSLLIDLVLLEENPVSVKTGNIR
jgi:hypothetical protein